MRVRRQYLYVRTGLVANIVIALLYCVAIAFIVFPSIVPFKYHIYIKPALERRVVSGVPVADVGIGYEKARIGEGISFGMATNLYRQKNGEIIVFLTNDKKNDVEVLCEIVDKKTEKILAESGRIKVGCYLERLKPKWGWKNEAVEVIVSVYALDGEGYSRGKFEFETVLQGW